MAPVAGPFVGAANPIRRIVGGGVAWQLVSAEGELKADGSLELEVRGAEGGGNAHIEARLALPHPCIAPIVFVNNGTVAAPGRWFAITGAP
jgi:hypothetical protein